MTKKRKTKEFATKKKSSFEVGASGTTNFQGNIDTDEYVSNLTGSTLYKTVDKMRWSDASVQAAVLMCELPIRSAEWDVTPASDSPEDTEIAEFVKDNLFNGLVSKWDDTIRQALLMQPYGVMVFEVVYKITEDGKIGWRKWAPRLPKTIEKWNVDKNGELESITQRAYKGDEYVEATISAEKLMVFVYRKEGDNYLGTSILRQAYKHWFFRDKYYKIDAVAQERLGIGIPVVTLPEGYTDDDFEKAKLLGQNFRGHEKAFIVIKPDWTVEMLDMKNSSLRDPTVMLEHHTREILKSVLAQFVDLGSKSGGSYALAKEQTATFLQALDSSAKILEEEVNKEIKKLVDYNWNVEEYPKLTHSDLGTKDVKEMSEAIQSLTFAGMITPDPETEDYLRTVLKLPEKPEGEEMDNKEEKEKKEQEMIKDKGSVDKKVDNKEKEKEKKEDKETYSEYFRPLTKAESRVKFDEIRDFMDEAETEIAKLMVSLLVQEKSRLIPLFEEAIRKKDYADLQRLSWSLKGQYAHLFREQIRKLFEFGKVKASYEIKRATPGTSADEIRRIGERSLFLANYHEKQMLEDLKGIAAVAMMDTEVSDEVALENISNGFNKFFNKNVPATSALVTSQEINNGRKYTFDSFKDDIYGYQWSAILDQNTCNYCRSMDGRVIGTEDRAFSEYRPGEVHFHCRCIWVGILDEEVDKPVFTGIPAGMRPQSQVPAWNFTDLEYPLPGTGKKKMPYGSGVFKEKNVK